MKDKIIDWNAFMKEIPPALNCEELDREWRSALADIPWKVIVLDDDPTGVQTVHDVPVYTSWDFNTLKKIAEEKSRVVYILTNSRALTAVQTEEVHRNLAMNLQKIFREAREEIVLISRSDSTLRGHFPLETQVIYEEWSKHQKIHGEIIIPFFLEGGRITFRDVHYVKQDDQLIPAAQTEFAKDTTFGYKSSNLREWVKEKTKNEFSDEQITSISLETLRSKDIEGIVQALVKVDNFGKVIVNAVDYMDLKVFVIGLIKALQVGKRFLFRTAASFVQVIGGISPKSLLTKQDLYYSKKPLKPGLIIVGSYVKKTTRQLNELRKLAGIEFVELEVLQAENQRSWVEELNRVKTIAERGLREGKNVCVFTSREYHFFDAKCESGDKNLAFSVRISNGLTQIVKEIDQEPGYIVAKGGITASDIGVNGLGVKRAMVIGQIQPGIPVWELGSESRFSGIPYVIFPGNVGNDQTLKDVVQILME